MQTRSDYFVTGFWDTKVISLRLRNGVQNVRFICKIQGYECKRAFKLQK